MTMLLRFLICVFGLLTSLSPLAAEDRALIIGINAYPHFPTKQLTGAVNDALAIERLAIDVWGFKPTQIKVLLEQAATSATIVDGIERWLIDGTKPGDRVLLYYSGHGYYVYDPTKIADEATRQTIAPSDARPDGKTIQNMILDTEIKQRLDRLTGRTIMFITDACHSGTLWRDIGDMTSGQPSIVRSLAHDARPPGLSRSVTTPAAFDAKHAKPSFVTPSDNLIAWSAVQPSELAEEDMELGNDARHGVFTRRFIEGLRDRKADRNGDGTVSAMELHGYISETVSKYCASNTCRSNRMTPMLEASPKLIGSNLLAWRPPGATPTKPARFEPTNILPATNTMGLKLDLLPGATVRLNKDIQLRLTSPKAGWLIVLDVRDNGEVVQLFPSKCARPNRQIRAGAVVTLPDKTFGCAFTATEPGSGQILAIITEDNVPVDDLLGRSRDLEVVANGETFLAELARRLLQAWTGDEKTRPTRWSLATARYTVER
jgi:metacaspase-1